MKVSVEVEETTLRTDDGNHIPGVVVRCPRCGAEEQSYGTSARSVSRCIVLLKEHCPKGESNYYDAPEAED